MEGKGSQAETFSSALRRNRCAITLLQKGSLLQLSKSSQNVRISIVSFDISPTSSPSEKIEVTAVAIPHITSELPLHLSATRSHLADFHLTGPTLRRPGKIDVLLGVDIYANVLLHGRRNGPPGSPVAFETNLVGFLLGKRTHLISHTAVSLHTMSHSLPAMIFCTSSGKLKEKTQNHPNLAPEE